MAGHRPHIIVFANEKGGTGKSTTAVHTAVALATTGHRVAALDLDTRQRTTGRYLDNRAATQRKMLIPIAMVTHETFDPAKGEPIGAVIDRMGAEADILVIDTPGRDDPHSRDAMTRADTLVTPINDSFVDLDLIGEVDPDTYRVRRPSFFAEVVWNSRTQRAKTHNASVDWVVLRNRLQHVDAHNMRRVANALGDLSRRVGFRVIPGLGERVIYRELFPRGLTLIDLPFIGEASIAPYYRAPGAARDDRRVRHSRVGGGAGCRVRRPPGRGGLMIYLLPVLAIGLFWAWKTGRLRRLTLDDGIAVSLFLLGLRLLTTGRLLTGAVLMAGALFYGAIRRGRFRRPDPVVMPVEDARRLLGVAADATEEDIRAAHRRLIARVHPDAGGSDELARRVNAARDALIAARARARGTRGTS